jgi:hypothetical protein
MTTQIFILTIPTKFIAPPPSAVSVPVSVKVHCQPGRPPPHRQLPPRRPPHYLHLASSIGGLFSPTERRSLAIFLIRYSKTRLLPFDEFSPVARCQHISILDQDRLLLFAPQVAALLLGSVGEPGEALGDTLFLPRSSTPHPNYNLRRC